MTTTTKKTPVATPTEKKAPRDMKLRAMQPIFGGSNQRVIEEGEVFLFTGTDAPAEHIAMPVDDNTPLGMYPVKVDPNDGPLPWTTQGFVETAQRAEGSGGQP